VYQDNKAYTRNITTATWKLQRCTSILLDINHKLYD
jgi:hypothetical protein